MSGALSDDEIAVLVAKSGLVKFPDAICRKMGWRTGVNGRPQEWYAAFRGWLGDALERVLRIRADGREK